MTHERGNKFEDRLKLEGFRKERNIRGKLERTYACTDQHNRDCAHVFSFVQLLDQRYPTQIWHHDVYNQQGRQCAASQARIPTT